MTSAIHFPARLLRYGVTGGLISAAYSLGVILMVEGFPVLTPTWASVVAFFAVQPLAYFAHRRISFPDAKLRRATWIRFGLTNLAGFTIAVVGMTVVTEILRASYLWAIALNWVLIPIANFLIYRAWVFTINGPG